MIAYITELNKDNYDLLEKGVCLLDISAPWCSSCRNLDPIVNEISSDYFGKINVFKMNADENFDFVNGLGIRSIPTIIIYKDGEIVERNVGMISKSNLEELIKPFLDEN